MFIAQYLLIADNDIIFHYEWGEVHKATEGVSRSQVRGDGNDVKEYAHCSVFIDAINF
jgi:hypothetical protein